MKPSGFSQIADAPDQAVKEAGEFLPHTRLPSPPPVPLLLCGKNGAIRAQNDAAFREIRDLKEHTSLFPYLSPEGRRFFGKAAEGGGGFLSLSLSPSLPSARSRPLSAAAERELCFLAALSSYRKAVVLLGLPFFYPPAKGKALPSGKSDGFPAASLTAAVATFIASRFLGGTAFREPIARFPWLDARAFALGFEESASNGLRSVDRILRFAKCLFSFPELFPDGRSPEIDSVMKDPAALFVEHSDAALVLLLTLARFSLDTADMEAGEKRVKFSFYFQEDRLFIELSVPSVSAPLSPAGGGKAAHEVRSAVTALEAIYFPDNGFRGFSFLAPSRGILLASLQNLCRRFGWTFRGGLFPEPEGGGKLFLQLDLPVLHRKGAMLYSERTDERSDFLRFLSFLCPHRS